MIGCKVLHNCIHCNNQFEAYANRHRKFCSEKCYGLHQSLLKKNKSSPAGEWMRRNKGRIIVSEETRKKLSLSKRGKPTWLKGRTGVYSMETIIKKRQSAKRGKDCHLWKGGITKENHLIRMSSEYKIWRKSIFEKDNYTCQACGIHSGNGETVYFQAHHILPFAKFPHKRFDISNGMTLCIKCHYKIYHKEFKNVQII